MWETLLSLIRFSVVKVMDEELKRCLTIAGVKDDVIVSLQDDEVRCRSRVIMFMYYHNR